MSFLSSFFAVQMSFCLADDWRLKTDLAILAAAVPSLQLPRFQPGHPPNRHKMPCAIAEIAENVANREYQCPPLPTPIRK